MGTKNTDEIDLVELLAKILRSVKQNSVTGIIFIVSGILISLAISFLISEIKRESHMMLVTNLLSEKEARFLFEQLNKADTLPGLSKELEKEVIKINYEVLKKEAADIDPRVFVEVTAEVNDPKIFKALEMTIVNYLNNSEPVIRNRKNQSKLYSEMIQKIDQELKAMDEVKKNVSNQNSTYLDPSELFAKSVDLYQRRTTFEIELAELKSIKVVKGFGTLTKDAKFHKIVIALIGLSAGLFAFLLYLALKAFSAYYKKFETSS